MHAGFEDARRSSAFIHERSLGTEPPRTETRMVRLSQAQLSKGEQQEGIDCPCLCFSRAATPASFLARRPLDVGGKLQWGARTAAWPRQRLEPIGEYSFTTCPHHRKYMSCTTRSALRDPSKAPDTRVAGVADPRGLPYWGALPQSLLQPLITPTAAAVEFVAYRVFGGVVLMVFLSGIEFARRDDFGDDLALEWLVLL